MTDKRAAQVLQNVLNGRKDKRGDTEIDIAIKKGIMALERPQGEWIEHRAYNGYFFKSYWECSVCHDNKLEEQKRNFCPNCCAVITGPVCEYCGTRFEESEERVIPIYMGNEQVGEAFVEFQSIAYNFGNPARNVKSPSLPIEEQR